jgi:hypothetical protein
MVLTQAEDFPLLPEVRVNDDNKDWAKSLYLQDHSGHACPCAADFF